MPTVYEKLGRKIEDMPTSQNYDVTSVIDVTGTTDVTATAGTQTTSTSPVIFNSKSHFAKFIDIAVERGYELTQLEKEFLVVRNFKRVGSSYEAGLPIAYKQKGIVEPGDYASGNQSLEMAATIHWIGDKTFGTYDASSTTDGFEPEDAPPAENEIHYKDGDAKRSDYAIYYIHQTA